MSRYGSALALSSPDDPSVTSPEARWQQLFGVPAPARMPCFLEQAIAWKEQVLAHGDVSPAIARDLRVIAADVVGRRAGKQVAGEPDGDAGEVDAPEVPCTTAAAATASSNTSVSGRVGSPRANSRSKAPSLPPASSQLLPGTRLVKAYGDKNHVVEVETGGFRYEGQLFGSLSAVAKHITGTHWNGLLFFGLRKRRTYPPKAHARG